MTIVLTRTPETITASILRACHSLGLQSAPAFVAINPTADAVANRCIHNVHRAASGGDGGVVVGWKILDWPRVLVQFIGHAVLRCGDRLVCITPDAHGEQCVLFVEDPSIEFDSTDPNARMPSFYHATDPHPDVADFIRVEEQIHAIKTKFTARSGPLLLKGADAALLQGLQVQQVRLVREVALRTRKPNERCVCDSGRKFRKCCQAAMATAQRDEEGRRSRA